MSNKEHVFFKGPAVHVHFHVKQGLIHQIDLTSSSSSSLQWSIYSDIKNSETEHLIQTWLADYVNGSPTSTHLPLDWHKIAPFTTKVLLEIQMIPFGSALSYGELACLIRHPTAARAVGRACGQNPFPLFIPCHRVLNAKRALCGFSEGLDIKKALLQFEKISFKN